MKTEMKKIIISIIIGFIILTTLHFTGIEINRWYIWLPVYLISLYIAGYINFLGTNAIISKFGFQGSRKNENKFTSLFSVEFVVGFGKKAQLRGIIDSDSELTKNNVLDIISSTEKKKIISGIKEMEDGPPLFSMFFDYDYDYLGSKITVSYKPLEEIDFRIGGVYKDRESK